MSISPVLPAICFGGSAVVSGLLLTLTPETKDLPLMDTVDQVNECAKGLRDAAIEKKEGKANLGFDGESTK